MVRNTFRMQRFSADLPVETILKEFGVTEVKLASLEAYSPCLQNPEKAKVLYASGEIKRFEVGTF